MGFKISGERLWDRLYVYLIDFFYRRSLLYKLEFVCKCLFVCVIVALLKFEVEKEDVNRATPANYCNKQQQQQESLFTAGERALIDAGWRMLARVIKNSRYIYSPAMMASMCSICCLPNTYDVSE